MTTCFSWQEDDAVYAGTAPRMVQRLSKATGPIEAAYACDSPVVLSPCIWQAVRF